MQRLFSGMQDNVLHSFSHSTEWKFQYSFNAENMGNGTVFCTFDLDRCENTLTWNILYLLKIIWFTEITVYTKNQCVFWMQNSENIIVCMLI